MSEELREEYEIEAFGTDPMTGIEGYAWSYERHLELKLIEKERVSVEDFFKEKFGNELSSNHSWVLRFAEEYANSNKTEEE